MPSSSHRISWMVVSSHVKLSTLAVLQSRHWNSCKSTSSLTVHYHVRSFGLGTEEPACTVDHAYPAIRQHANTIFTSFHTYSATLLVLSFTWCWLMKQWWSIASSGSNKLLTTVTTRRSPTLTVTFIHHPHHAIRQHAYTIFPAFHAHNTPCTGNVNIYIDSNIHTPFTQ